MFLELEIWPTWSIGSAKPSRIAGFPANRGRIGNPWGKGNVYNIVFPLIWLEVRRSDSRIEDSFRYVPSHLGVHKTLRFFFAQFLGFGKTIPSFVGFVDGLFAQGRQAYQDSRTEFGDLEDGVSLCRHASGLGIDRPLGLVA